MVVDVERISAILEKRIADIMSLQKWYYSQGQYYSCIKNEIKAEGIQEALDTIRRLASEK